MVAARDIFVERTATGARSVAVLDLGDRRLDGVAQAVDALRHARYAQPALDVDEVLGLAALRTLSDQIELAAAAGSGGTLRLYVEQVQLLAEAVGGYLLRDADEGYQPPELRNRLALLRPLAGELFDLVSELHETERRLDEQRGA
jgi:hypothetical protein